MATKAKAKKAAPKEELALELNGEVNIVERKGRKVTRTPLDGDVVLKCLIWCLERSLDLMTEDLEKET